MKLFAIAIFIVICAAPFALSHITDRTVKNVDNFSKHMDYVNSELQINIENSLKQQYKTSDSILKVSKYIYKKQNELIVRQNKLIKEMEERLIMEENAINNYYKVFK